MVTGPLSPTPRPPKGEEALYLQHPQCQGFRPRRLIFLRVMGVPAARRKSMDLQRRGRPPGTLATLHSLPSAAHSIDSRLHSGQCGVVRVHCDNVRRCPEVNLDP